ncbi:2-phospho-L-lactate guanylyltransferase [Sphingobium tyrosinilyticum]|uniref:2-phospho-L-lactate guanylyltransferase n=1 Tax=Sphingobium tyrosinilyticum TaxID=2715436 RepID=A0ABV9F1Y7_9SPHN
MNCWVFIPIKSPAYCKTRLAPVLDEAERQYLVAAMLERVYTAACAVAGPDRTFILGPSRHALGNKVRQFGDPGVGLNPAATSARDAALQGGVERLILLSADLPRVTTDDVAALINIPARTIAVAPDESGQGTNALSLPLPQASDFRFHYGLGSCAAHREEAARLALPLLTIVRPDLAFDIDEPAELAGWYNAGPNSSFTNQF